MNKIQIDAAQSTPAPLTANASSLKDANTITADDFLTLLVTQMKNQDPTSPTDPAQYMQQLVGVNSLQQLIGINQQLSSMNGANTSTHQA